MACPEITAEILGVDLEDKHKIPGPEFIDEINSNK